MSVELGGSFSLGTSFVWILLASGRNGEERPVPGTQGKKTSYKKKQDKTSGQYPLPLHLAFFDDTFCV